jgi:hypothetical protein
VVIEDGVCASTSSTPRSRPAANIAVSRARTPLVRSVGPVKNPASPSHGARRPAPEHVEVIADACGACRQNCTLALGGLMGSALP